MARTASTADAVPILHASSDPNLSAAEALIVPHRAPLQVWVVRIASGLALLAIAAGCVAMMCTTKTVHGRNVPIYQDVSDSLRIPEVLPWLRSSTMTTSTTTRSTTTLSTTTRTGTSTSTQTATATHTTTATTTRTHTATETATTTTSTPMPKLYCFTVMRGIDSELSLMREQLAHGAGIYGCDDWVVLSDIETWLSPGPPVALNTTLITADLKATGDGISTKYKNAVQFLRAWEKLRELGRYKLQDFVVKVDPDAVFLPNRLRSLLARDGPPADQPVFYANCQAEGHPHFLFGAIEVFSRGAVEAFFSQGKQCESALESEEMWEERYMADCLRRLHVPMAEHLELLHDEHCGLGAEPLLPCVAHDIVSFHPLRTPSEYLTCWEEAMKVDAPPRSERTYVPASAVENVRFLENKAHHK